MTSAHILSSKALCLQQKDYSRKSQVSNLSSNLREGRVITYLRRTDMCATISPEIAAKCIPSDGNFKNLLSVCPLSLLSEWETKCNNFFSKNLFLLLNKLEIFTPLGHKKSCFPELIILSKDLAQIEEVTTVTFCQIIMQKILNMLLQNFKENSTKDDQE